MWRGPILSARTSLGGLNLTIDGLKQRDELVFRAARARNIPVMTTYAGGYAVEWKIP